MDSTSNTTPEEWVLREGLQRLSLAVPQVPPVSPRDPDMRIALAIPVERTMLQEAFFGFAAILQQGWSLAQLPYTRNDVARHKFARFLLDEGYTHLLMLDSDHVHPPDIVQRLARWFVAYPDLVQVVGGLNFRRGEPYDPCAFVDPGDGQFHRLAEWGEGAVQVDALGTGSIMIAKSVFERLPEEQGWFDYQYPDHNQWPGTDMTFSARCREAGIALWVDTTTTSPHIGTHLIDERDYRRFIAEQEALARARVDQRQRQVPVEAHV